MRSFLIRQALPLLFCLGPVIGGALLVAAVPTQALSFYANNISYIDWIILGLGAIFFVVQLILAFRALRWQERGFDERPDPMLQGMYQAAEWFPLLGLFGTVAGILQTFAAIGARDSVPQSEIIKLYAPALTTTGSGLLMAFMNIVPLWLVMVGRRVILTLAMTPAPPAKEP